MAEITANERLTYGTGNIHWGAVWSGMFTFATIWSIFGALGMAIFASSANPNANAPVTGQSTGMAVWSIILTIIAMYVAGRVTGRIAGAGSRQDGVIHGTTMFGLSVVAAVLITALAGAVLSGGTGVPGTAHSGYILGVFADLGWAGFIALLLGWIAAMGGGAQGAASKTNVASPSNVRDIRPAA